MITFFKRLETDARFPIDKIQIRAIFILARETTNKTMNAQTKETCKALEMLERSEILDVNGYLLQNWSLDTLDCDDSEEVFSCSYKDEEGYIFEFAFSKKSLLDAGVKDHTLSLLDDTGELIDIACYSLQALN